MQCRKPLGQVRPRGRVHVTGPPRWPCLASDLSVRLRGCVLPRRGRALVGAGREAIQPPRVDFIGKLRVGCMDRMVTGPRSHARSDVAAGRSVTSTRRCVQSLCVWVPAGQCAALASGRFGLSHRCSVRQKQCGTCFTSARGDGRQQVRGSGSHVSETAPPSMCGACALLECASCALDSSTRRPTTRRGPRVARAVRSGGGDRAWSRISQHNYVI